MIDDDKSPAGFSLRRWSARKRAAVGAAGVTPATTPASAAPSVTATVPATATASAAPGPPADGGEGRALPTVLPPVETLTPSSDFTPFMQPDVDPALRQAALHKLFADPQFNVMDGLDVYIDDYSKPDPISPEMVRALHHARYIFSPPPTRMNEAGYVEDVPEDEREPAAGAAAGAPMEVAAPDPAPLAAPDAAAETLPAPAVPASPPVASGPAEAGAATSSPPPQAVLPLERPPPPTR
jgi:hypothetical protein